MVEGNALPVRMLFVDNIRWLIIVFVVLTHAAVTYSGMGSWYYRELEPAELDLLSIVIFGIYLAFTQAYSMGLLFLLAGYFTPPAFDRKGGARFLMDRAVRLGIPTLIYMILINTAINYYILTSDWATPRPPLAQYLLGYVISLRFLSGSGPMWFALTLLIFSAAYAAFRRFAGYPLRAQEDGDLPGHYSVAGLILLISALAFSIRLVQPIGTSIMNMQLCFFSQYIILFLLGIISYRKNWLVRVPRSFGLAWFLAALTAGPVFWLAIMILGGGASGDLPSYSGGLHWQSAAYALWESFFCIGASLGLIVLFRERYNFQGRLSRFLSENYFSVYVFHAPILILVALALSGFAWHPLLKFAAAGTIAVLLSFLASGLVLRRIPLLKKVI